MVKLTTLCLFVASASALPQLHDAIKNIFDFGPLIPFLVGHEPKIGDTFNDLEKKQLKDGFKDAIALANAGIDACNKDNAIFKKYFNEQQVDSVKKILENIVGTDRKGSDKLETVTIRSDFPDIDGDLSCTEPRFMAATRDDPNEDRADTIICPSGLAHGGINKGYTDDKGPAAVECKNLDERVTWKMDTLGSILLHEYTHVSGLTLPILTDGTYDEDFDGNEIYGPIDSRKPKDEGADLAILIADVYAWYCNEAFWTAECKKEFKDPIEGDDKDPACGDDKCVEAEPEKKEPETESPPKEDPPKSESCDCNENGCTPESPPCCANGTCPWQPKYDN